MYVYNKFNFLIFFLFQIANLCTYYSNKIEIDITYKYHGHGPARVVVGFTTTYSISPYHH